MPLARARGIKCSCPDKVLKAQLLSSPAGSRQQVQIYTYTYTNTNTPTIAAGRLTRRQAGHLSFAICLVTSRALVHVPCGMWASASQWLGAGASCAHVVQYARPMAQARPTHPRHTHIHIHTYTLHTNQYIHGPARDQRAAASGQRQTQRRRHCSHSTFHFLPLPLTGSSKNFVISQPYHPLFTCPMKSTEHTHTQGSPTKTKTTCTCYAASPGTARH